MRKYWLAAVACILALLSGGPTVAAPSYMSYWGLGWNIPEAQDHVNLYWAVSWMGDGNEILNEVADAKARGMRAMVHADWALFNGSGPSGNACPYTLKPDYAARWDSFAQQLSTRGLIDNIAAFYPLDEPDLCDVSSSDLMAALNVIRSHPLTTGKPIAVIFGCDIAKKYGGPYGNNGHSYGNAMRSFDWVGVDCYGNNIFIDPAWSTREFDIECFCFHTTSGPPIYDNLKLQLNLPPQRLILVPQGFIFADSDGLPDDPQVFANHAATDPSVILMAPFTWFDQPFYPGVRSQPALAQQWRNIGRSIALTNPPNANPPLPPAIPPRLQVTASDVQHFSVYDFNCNTSDYDVCSVELFWEAANTNLGTQLFMRQGAGAPQLVACELAMSYVDIPWISRGVDFKFDLYQLGSCPTTPPPNATPVARLSMFLVGTTFPEAPTAVSATAGDALAIVNFTPGALGSGTLLYHTADCGGITATGSASPITVTGLTNGTSYTCRVDTTTTMGTSPWSANSNSVIPKSSNASLANLVLSAGMLSPTFASATLNYTAGVASINNTITVTPTVVDANATVAVNGVTVASGSASDPIVLSVGSNPIAVVVTAQDAVTAQTYNVDVSYRLPSSCTYSVTPLDLSNMPAAGASTSVTVTTPAGCPVAATSYQPWVTINGITPSGGTTEISLQISANTGMARATTIQVADRLFLITQPGP